MPGNGALLSGCCCSMPKARLVLLSCCCRMSRVDLGSPSAALAGRAPRLDGPCCCCAGCPKEATPPCEPLTRVFRVSALG